MVQGMHHLFILIYLLTIACNATLEQPIEQQTQLAETEKDPIPPIYNTPPQPPVKILRETSPITQRESIPMSDEDLQQSAAYTYSYYRPVYHPGVYYLLKNVNITERKHWGDGTTHDNE